MQALLELLGLKEKKARRDHLLVRLVVVVLLVQLALLAQLVLLAQLALLVLQVPTETKVKKVQMAEMVV